MLKFSQIVDRVKVLCSLDPAPDVNKALFLTEECGEVALALNVESGYKKRVLKENSSEESCDVILAALWIALSREGWDRDKLLSYIDKKLVKWEDRIRKLEDKIG